MTDSIDNAVTQSANRAVFVGFAVSYLGKDRQRDAELLAELMIKAIEQICRSACVLVDPRHSGVPGEVLTDLAAQMLKHGEAVAHEAVRALSRVFVETLRIAAAVPAPSPHVMN